MNTLFEPTVNDLIQQLPSEERGKVSDGSHTFDELYEMRLALTVALFHTIAINHTVTKSWRHSDGELCFGGGWFIVQAELPTGQVSFHYEAKHFNKFKIYEAEKAGDWDGHTTEDVITRLLNV